MSAAMLTTATEAWGRGAQTGDEILEEGDPVLASRSQLLVTMTFNPNNDGSVAPTLHSWRQMFDCVPAE
jgi:hypothetical protein